MSFQKRQPLPLSPQNYPLHGADVNGFHSGSGTYNHTSSVNGADSIMGVKSFICLGFKSQILLCLCDLFKDSYLMYEAVMGMTF